MKAKSKTPNKRHKEELPKDNFSVARFVDEGNPDSLIKQTQEKSGENTDQPIPDGDQP